MTPNSPILIRPAAPDDLAVLAAIEAEVAPRPWSLQQFREELALPHAHVLCAHLDGAPVGYLDMHVVGDDAHINELGVSPAHQRKGVATALVTAALALAGERGCPAVTLEVRTGNTAARALYGAIGFTSLGVRRNFYESPREDAVIMQKEIG